MESIQIPDSLLKKIPTESLLDSCLCYPYFINFLFYNSFEEGLLALEKNYNGFRELRKRNNLNATLLRKKQLFSKELYGIINSSDVEIGTWSLQQLLLDFLLSEEKTFSLLSNSQKNYFLSYADTIDIVRKKSHNIFGTINELPFKMIKNRIKNTKSPYTVYTPNGSLVSDTYIIEGEDYYYSPTELAALANSLEMNYNGAILLDKPSRKYNCHAYAWNIS